MDHQLDQELDRVAEARHLLAAAKQGVDQLENEASQAFCRWTALAGMMAQLDKLALLDHPDADEAMKFYAATVCRDAKALLRSINSREWVPIRITAISKYRERPRPMLERTSN